MNLLNTIDKQTLTVIVGIGVVLYFFGPSILALLVDKARSVLPPIEPTQTTATAVPKKELPYTYLNVPDKMDTTCTATDLGNLTAIEIELGIVTEGQPDYGLYEFRANRIKKIAKELETNEKQPVAKKR